MDVFLLSIVISTNKTEAAVQDTNEGTLNVQWEDENFGESICNALKKEEVTYADIEGITGISIDSQYVVKLDWKDKTEEYVYNSGNDMCEILALQEFSTLEDLKKFPYLRELCLNECIVDDNTALGELTKLENLKLDGYSIDSLDRLKNLTALKSLIIQGAEFEDLQALKELTNMEELRLPNNNIKNIDACVIVFYKSDTEAETKNKSNFEFEVMNYDPVLPVRMKTLKIRKENDKLILELTYAEFEWAGIEEFIVDIQLVRYDGTVNTFVQNALFEKKGQNFARFQLQDAGYDLDGIASARVNILVYNIYKSQKKHVEKGSGFSAYSDYSVDELRSARFANSNMVMCMEKNIGKNHQCCCGQVYSNKNNKCPLCGKERRDK